MVESFVEKNRRSSATNQQCPNYLAVSRVTYEGQVVHTRVCTKNLSAPYCNGYPENCPINGKSNK